jgi:hypothetical protein
VHAQATGTSGSAIEVVPLQENTVNAGGLIDGSVRCICIISR